MRCYGSPALVPLGATCPTGLAYGIQFINASEAGPKPVFGKGFFEELQEPDLDWLMIDSTVVRAHQHAAGQKKATPPARA
ncbi:hypothetical protein GCM10027577_17770 [Spirosoma fluminis]